MNTETTPTPKTDSERNRAFCNLRTDCEAYAYMANRSETLERALTEKTNEVEKLREELDRLKRGCQGSCYACEPVGEMNLKLEAEVARLRELLNRAIEIAETLSGGGSRACRELHHAKKDRHESDEVCPVEERLEKAISDLAKLKAEAQLAPSPEEPMQ